MIEMVEINKKLLSPCGLYCGVCAIYMAHRDNNLKFKEKLVSIYRPYTKSVEDVKCKGCLSDEKFGWCQTCPIRNCAQEKGYEGCYQCNDFPCKMIDRFPMEVGKKVISRAVPQWKELGTEKWVEMEEKRYICPNCGNKLFRGAKRCNKCSNNVDVD
jgi:hypothetical protein